MITKDLLKKIIIEQRETFSKTDNYIKRAILADKDFDKICSLKEIMIVTGVRRSGKSYLMKLIWKKIKSQKKANQDNFLYFNFEDEKLIDFQAKDFDLLIESYYELFNPLKKEKIYLFFDEIQNIVNWEKFINRLQRSDEYKILITGSNATLLSKEIHTALTGRSYQVNLFPLSFKEFAQYKMQKKLKPDDIFQAEIKINLLKLFDQYQKNGGFPEVVLQDFRPLLQEYLKNIIYRDIVLRYRIKNEASLREITAYIISNIGTVLSLEKISKMTKVKNLMTVKNYLGYLENSFLFYLVPKYSYSIKKQIYNPDKIYVIDTGMYNEIAFLTSANEGRLLENLVYLELKRRNKEVYYFSNKQECDFVIKEKNMITQAIQVTKLLSPENKDREVNGLISAMKKYNLKKGLILTKDNEETIKIEEKTIKIKPIWQWLLFR